MNQPATRSCAWAQSRLPLLPSEDLATEESRDLREHLASCFCCARELGEWLRLRQRLVQLGDAIDPLRDGSEAFFAALQRDVLQRVADRQPGVASRGFGSRQLWLRGGAAAALFLVGLLVVRWVGPAEPPLLESSPLTVPARYADAADPRLTNLGRMILQRGTSRLFPSYGLQGRAQAVRAIHNEIVMAFEPKPAQR